MTRAADIVTALEAADLEEDDLVYLVRLVDAMVARRALKWTCVVCGQDARGHYMVTHELWAATIGDTYAGLCHLACFERRLGRPLTRADFLDVPVNDSLFWGWERGLEGRP